jgi:restriction endonuclease S subunit
MPTINDIAHIQTGVYEKPKAFGEIYYVQARHFDNNRKFIESVTPDLIYDKKLEKHFLQKGDVLVAARGFDYFAVDYKGIIGPAVASSTFIVLRPKPNILSEYLAWFINHPKTQNALNECSKGTSIQSITKNDIGDLPILIPTLYKQEVILKIESLRQQELHLKKQIELLRYSVIQETIFNHLQKHDT